jgi:hypothetical protein
VSIVSEDGAISLALKVFVAFAVDPGNQSGWKAGEGHVLALYSALLQMHSYMLAMSSQKQRIPKHPAMLPPLHCAISSWTSRILLAVEAEEILRHVA